MKNKDNFLLKSTLIVSLLALFGKVLGFARGMLIGARYGATAETDVFFFTQSMPTDIFPGICSGIATAFLALYVPKLVKSREAGAYASRMLEVTGALGAVFSIIGAMFAPAIVYVFAPGFVGAQKELAVQLTRLTMVTLFLTMLHCMLGAVLDAHSLFVSRQVANFSYNLVIIAAILALGRSSSIYLLAASVVLARFIQAAVLAAGARIHHVDLRPSFLIIPSETKELLRLSAPVILGNASLYINSIVDRALASTLAGGSLSVLSYTDALTSIVTEVIIVSFITVAYPTLTAEMTRGEDAVWRRHLTGALAWMEYLLIPISCVTLFSANDVVSIVYGRGNFDQAALSHTARTLLCYAPMFIGVGYREVLSRVFYARGDTKTPMINTAVGVCCNVVISVALSRRLGIIGIALGTTIAAVITAGLLLLQTNNKMQGVPGGTIAVHLGRRLMAGIGCALALRLLATAGLTLAPLPGFLANTVVGFAVFFLLLPSLDKMEIVSTVRRLLPPFNK